MKTTKSNITDKYYPTLYTILFVVLIMAGGLTNLSVMVQNGNKMPIYVTEDYESIYYEELNDATHFPYTDKEEVQRHFFTDHKVPLINGIYLSYGDYMIFLGGFGMITLYLMKLIFYLNKKKKK